MADADVTERNSSSNAPKSEGDEEGWLDAFRATYLSADPRWLGVFRVVFGSLLTLDLIRRWANARAFYSNDGILPNHFSLFRPMGRDVFSIFHAFSTYGEVSVLFAVATVCGLLFTLGYKTKLFHVLSALFITSVNARNIFVENGGTVVMNILAIWTLFLPLGKRLSIDALLASFRASREQSSADLNDRSAPPRDDRPVVRLVVLALILQWSVIYFLNTVQKTGEGWRNGTALYWFWHQDRIATWLSVWSRDHVPLVVAKVLTWGTLVVEGTLAVILLLPFWRNVTRRTALVLSFALHATIAASSRLGPFSYAMVTFFLLVQTPAEWALISRWFGRDSRKRTVIYDADCGICLFSCRLLKRLDVFECLTFVGNDETDRIPDSLDEKTLDESAAAVMPDGAVHLRARAIYEITRALPFGILAVWWIRVPGLSAFADWLYRKVAAKRLDISAWFGLGVCGVPALAAAGAPSQSARSAVDASDRTSSSEGAVAPSEDDPSAGHAEREDDDELVARGGDGDASAARASGTNVEPGAAGDRGDQDDEDGEDDESDDSSEQENARTDEDGSDRDEAAEDAARARRRALADADALSRDRVYEPELSPARRDVRSWLGVGRELATAAMMVVIGSQVIVDNSYFNRHIKLKRPDWMQVVVNYPRIFQGWRMFAPEPPYDDGRLVVDGRTVDGRKLDPLMGGEPDFDPNTETGWGHSQFWCDYHNRIRFPHHSGHRQFLRDYLQHQHEFSGRPQDELVAFDVWWIEDKSPPPGQERGEVLPPKKLISFGRVKDSGADPWLKRTREPQLRGARRR